MKSVFSSSVLAVLVAMAANPARAAIDPSDLSTSTSTSSPELSSGELSDEVDLGDGESISTSGTSDPGSNWYPDMPGGPGSTMPAGPGTQFPDSGETLEPETPVPVPSVPTLGPAGVNHITGPGGVIPTQNPAFTFDFPSLNDIESPRPTANPTGTPTATPTDPVVAAPTANPTATPTDPVVAAPTANPTATPTDPVVAAPTAAPTFTPTGTPTTKTPTGNRPPISSGGTACPKDYVVLTLTDGNYTLDLPSPAPELITILKQGEDFVEFAVQNATSVFGVSDHVFTSFESGTFGEETCEMDEDLGTVDDPASASERMKAFCRVTDTGGKIALVKLYVRYPTVKKGAAIGKCCADPYKDTGYYTIALVYELKCRVCEQAGVLKQD